MYSLDFPSAYRFNSSVFAKVNVEERTMGGDTGAFFP